MKARADRGRKRMEWMTILNSMPFKDFERICKMGVRFDFRLLRQLALDIIIKSTSPKCKNER